MSAPAAGAAEATRAPLEGLLAHASITPEDAGCPALPADALAPAGMVCEHLPAGPAGAASALAPLAAIHRRTLESQPA